MRPRHLNQLTRFGKAKIVGLLLGSSAHACHRQTLHYPYAMSSRGRDEPAPLVGTSLANQLEREVNNASLRPVCPYFIKLPPVW